MALDAEDTIQGHPDYATTQESESKYLKKLHVKKEEDCGVNTAMSERSSTVCENCDTVLHEQCFPSLRVLSDMFTA